MRITSLDPATGEVLGEVEEASAHAVADAAQEARTARAGWSDLRVRLQAIKRFRALLAADRDEVAMLVTCECGKPLVEAHMADVLPTLEWAAFVEREAARILGGEDVGLRNPVLIGRRSQITRAPLGVVGVISPWNYPLSIPASGVLAALVAGNGVVVKPSEKTPLVGDRLAELLWQAGVPRELLHVVHGRGKPGTALVDHADGIIFTGSVATGQRVAEACARRFIPALLELGGKDPAVVLPGADRDRTVRGITWGAFTNAGQTCAAVERAYVPSRDWEGDLAAAAAALRVGPGTAADTDVGPVIDDDAVQHILAQIQAAEKAGAQVLCGGEVIEELGPHYIQPTVLSRVDHDMAVMRDETFGPVLPVMAFGDADEAVGLANDTPYGLAASVWGPRREAETVAERIEAGTTIINDCIYTFAAPETPWTGWKHSGHGVGHGRWVIEALTRLKHVNDATRRRSVWQFPYDDDLRTMMDGAQGWLHGDGGMLRAGRGYLKRR